MSIKILAKWRRGRSLCYLVKWEGFDEDKALLADSNKHYSEAGGNHLGVELLDKRIHGRKVEYVMR